MTPFLRRVLTRAAAALLAVAGCITLAHAAWEPGTDGLAPIPPFSARVVDRTGTLSAAQASALEAKLAAFTDKTGGQLAVLIVPSTAPEP
ncbi:MAG: TPM domain-containing protein, partial [Proteobacteria bacterium]|nr:TPM domain-containing protein [Pseudomonadota bacterium]